MLNIRPSTRAALMTKIAAASDSGKRKPLLARATDGINRASSRAGKWLTEKNPWGPASRSGGSPSRAPSRPAQSAQARPATQGSTLRSRAQNHATAQNNAYMSTARNPTKGSPSRAHGSSSAQAQAARNNARMNPSSKGQSYEEWSKGREGWTEDARRRRYARSREGQEYRNNALNTATKVIPKF